MTIVSPAKGDVAGVDVQEAMIGYSNSMSIAAEVIKDVLWATERTFGVDNPIELVEWMKEAGKCSFVGKMCKRAVKFQLLLLERLLEIVKEQSAKEAGQHSYGKKESLSAGDPTAAV
jgi:hypothetical protein